MLNNDNFVGAKMNMIYHGFVVMRKNHSLLALHTNTYTQTHIHNLSFSKSPTQTHAQERMNIITFIMERFAQ